MPKIEEAGGIISFYGDFFYINTHDYIGNVRKQSLLPTLLTAINYLLHSIWNLTSIKITDRIISFDCEFFTQTYNNYLSNVSNQKYSFSSGNWEK